MKKNVGMAFAVCSLCALVGCDVFWDAKFTQQQQASTTFVTPGQGNTEDLAADLRKFAFKYELKCESDINKHESLTCYSHAFSKVSGGFGIENGDSTPTINYRDAGDGGTAFFSKQSYCAHVSDIKVKLEEFTGPLKMEVSHTGGPPYDDCKS